MTSIEGLCHGEECPKVKNEVGIQKFKKKSVLLAELMEK